LKIKGRGFRGVNGSDFWSNPNIFPKTYFPNSKFFQDQYPKNPLPFLPLKPRALEINSLAVAEHKIASATNAIIIGNQILT